MDQVLILGPSFVSGPVEGARAEKFKTWLRDTGACEVFDLWYAGCGKNIPTSKNVENLFSSALSSNLYLEEYHPKDDSVTMHSIGEFFRKYTHVNKDGSYFCTWDDIDAVEVWGKIDEPLHMENKPVMYYYMLSRSEEGFRYLGEACLPVRGDDGRFFTLGYCWDLSKDEFAAIKQEFNAATSVVPLTC